MNKILFLILLSIDLILCNCHGMQNETVLNSEYDYNNGLIVKKEYKLIGNKRIISRETTFKIDTTKLYCKDFYQNGNIKDEFQYKKGKFSGRMSYFYENGQLNHFDSIKHGLLWGKSLFYYMDGHLQAKYYYYKDSKVGQQLLYYKSGSLKYYLLYDPVGSLVYQIKYDENGHILKESNEKHVLYMFQEYKNRGNIFYIDELFYITFYTPTPPSYKVSLDISIMNDQDHKVFQMNYPEVKEGKEIFRKYLYKVGRYQLIMTAHYLNLKTNKRTMDRESFDYEVKSRQ